MSAVHWRTGVARAVVAGAGPFGHVRPLLREMREAREPFSLLHLRRAPRLVAFSRRDELQRGFAAACEAARELGFDHSVRPVGGTFAPVHQGSLIIDEYGYRPRAGMDPVARFERHARLLRDVFVELGIDARIGPVDDEYCPGTYSVNARGLSKLSGTAQRVSGDAWLVSSVVQVEATEALLAVTGRCARMLGQRVDVATIGSLSGEVGPIGIGEVGRRVAHAFRASGVVGRGGVLGAAGI